MRADHWLYRIIPASRDVCRWWQWPLWALFGNDDDGLFGETYTTGWYKDGTPSLWLAVRWWARNPCYNLCTRVINWPRSLVRVVYARAEGQGPPRWWFPAPQFRWYVDQWPRPRQFAAVFCPPYVAWTGRRIEGYFGWGSSDGRFGFALRPAHSPDAADV